MLGGMRSSYPELFHPLVRGLPGCPNLGCCDLPGFTENAGDALLVLPSRVPTRRQKWASIMTLTKSLLSPELVFKTFLPAGCGRKVAQRGSSQHILFLGSVYPGKCFPGSGGSPRPRLCQCGFCGADPGSWPFLDPGFRFPAWKEGLFLRCTRVPLTISTHLTVGTPACKSQPLYQNNLELQTLQSTVWGTGSLQKPA